MKFWKDGFYLEQSATGDRIEITDEYWQQLLDEQSKGSRIVGDTSGYPIYEMYQITPEEYIENLKARRENECFSIINRGIFWYEMLTETQKQELKIWYNAWLNITVTKVAPEKPIWLE